MKIISLIEEIRENPAMYLNRISVFALKSFLDGYTLGSKKEIEELHGFQNFIVDKYRINPTLSWDSIIYLYCNNDKHSFDKFFELFDLFLEQRKSI